MNLIPNTVTRTVARQALTFKKQSPHIFFAGGIVGFVGTTVLACRATLQLSDVLDTFHEDVEAVKGLGKDLKEGNGNPDYDETQFNKDMAYVYGKGTIAIAKLYAPAVAVGAVSIAALTGSHISMTRRNTALTATLVAVSEAFNKYRESVQEKIGEERELDIFHDVDHRKSVKDEEGNKELLPVVGDPNKYSPYARLFDEYNVNWEKNAELNKLFVTCQQTHANNLLISRGHIFLNEVYDLLGLERSQAGSVVGWVIGHDGDNYVDFGMYSVEAANFVNGYERSILLDFNVDGVIFDKI